MGVAALGRRPTPVLALLFRELVQGLRLHQRRLRTARGRSRRLDFRRETDDLVRPERFELPAR
jgi:hypothetical protein